MTEQIQEQLIDIETKLQFQEDTIQQLDKVIVQQQTAIKELSRRLELMEKKAQELNAPTDASSHSDHDEKPPHY